MDLRQLEASQPPFFLLQKVTSQKSIVIDEARELGRKFSKQFHGVSSHQATEVYTILC